MAKDDVIGPNGRTVRCTKCSATWFVPAIDDPASTPDELQLVDITQAEADPSPDPLHEPTLQPTPEPVTVAQTGDESPVLVPTHKSADSLMRDKADSEKKRARRRTIWFIWLIPIFFIFAVLAALYFGRTKIAESFPATVPAYNAFGVKVSQSGLVIDPPTLRMAVVNGQTTVVINGVVRNISNQAQALPMLRLSLHNPAGEEVANWLVDLEKPILRGQGRLEFASEYPNPPPDSTSLHYRLVK